MGGLWGEAASPAPILFVVDASGSMTELFGRVPRMVAARVMLLEELKRIDPKVPVGLVAYGNRIAGCRSHRIYAPIRTQNRRSLVQQIQGLYPAGATPIANTLRLIGQRILPYYPKTTVVIISDGAESCGGDPVSEVQKLMQRGYDIRFQVIGLDVDNLTALQLRAIARAGKGKYFGVNSQIGFADALAQSTYRQEARLTKPKINPKPVVPGNALLRITKAFAVQEADGSLTWHVRYVFQAERPGRYLVRISALERPIHEGRQGRIPGDKHLLFSEVDAYYAVQEGHGEVLLPQEKLGLSKNESFFLQGELWDVSAIPESLFVSEAVAVRSG